MQHRLWLRANAKKTQTAGWLTAILGGNWNNSSNNGGFNWNLNNSSANRNRNHGAHLVHAINKTSTKAYRCITVALAKTYKLNLAVLVG